MHALIIEDDAAIAGFIARGLREAGFAADVAADGNEGLEAALTQQPDVIIVDLMLPGRDGLSVIDELLKRYIEALVYQAVAENMASEHAARMVAIEGYDAPVLGTEGARTFDSYYARPASGRGPGLVILTAHDEPIESFVGGFNANVVIGIGRIPEECIFQHALRKPERNHIRTVGRLLAVLRQVDDDQIGRAHV